ncbi:RluA family pseudouridine synthase [Lewinella sp. W8]|uniref:RluA family pseudouridine synthase n=1 Tax=Lewinella sp. W8 TaxID=2528208 RepID=UPI0010683F00|nr:RluA family pseudouridine synthase [Lewinella sp. W8]MTB52914.1 RluA family pseudouridine synthase [Lewinella sp. W8]
MKVPIIFEDEHLLVVNKPAGLLTVPDRYDPGIGNLVHYLGTRYGDPILPVHRLDRPTSGVVVVARTPAAHKELNRQFREREVDKIYHALVEGVPAAEEAEIDEPIGPNPGKSGQMMVTARGKYALTLYKVMEPIGDQFSLVGVQIFTGRTHQIRVHLAYIGHPLVVDPFYGKRTEFMLSEIKGRKYRLGKHTHEERPLLNRVPLHAHRLAFTHPATGERMSFEAERPKDMRAVLNQLRKLVGGG